MLSTVMGGTTGREAMEQVHCELLHLQVRNRPRPLTCEKLLSFCGCRRPIAVDQPSSVTSEDLVEQLPSSAATPLD
ncbi:hypothetical protein BHE74_00007839 [Ensete ventricosum]|nr:hypothetical protein BHE74_00007839 [Ensete ventricosum]